MQIKARNVYFLLDPNTHIFATVKITFCIETLFECFGVFLKSFICFLLDLCLYAYVCYCLLTLDHPECEACYYESLQLNERQQGKFTLIIIFNTKFLLCISLTLKDCTDRIGNMWICYVVHVVGTYDLLHNGILI